VVLSVVDVVLVLVVEDEVVVELVVTGGLAPPPPPTPPTGRLTAVSLVEVDDGVLVGAEVDVVVLLALVATRTTSNLANVELRPFLAASSNTKARAWPAAPMTI
jgi:hypothetical protein